MAGIGNYDGFSNTTFSIRADLSKRCSKATVGAISKKTYTGSKIKPSPIVKAVGANGKVVKLKKGTDYKLTYKNNKKIGKAKVIITGKGYYKGSLTKSFIIKPAAGSLTRAWGYPHEIVLKAKEKGGGVSYQFAYKKNGGSWKYKTRKTVNADLKDLSAGKYSVKVRCIKKVNGTIYKGKWSKAKTVKVTSSETKSQKKAYRTAKSYSKVRGYGGYSKFTLVDALKHDGFSEKDATYGVRKLDERGEVNWKKQALEEARRVKAEFNWSRKQVRDQLKVQEFTDAQIKYAMDRL